MSAWPVAPLALTSRSRLRRVQMGAHDARWAARSQQDAHEFMLALFAVLQAECDRNTRKPRYRELGGEGCEAAQARAAAAYLRLWSDSVVDDVFGGLLQSTLRCEVRRRRQTAPNKQDDIPPPRAVLRCAPPRAPAPPRLLLMCTHHHQHHPPSAHHLRAMAGPGRGGLRHSGRFGEAQQTPGVRKCRHAATRATASTRAATSRCPCPPATRAALRTALRASRRAKRSTRRTAATAARQARGRAS